MSKDKPQRNCFTAVYGGTEITVNNERLFLAADSGGSKTVWTMLNDGGDILTVAHTLGMGAVKADMLPIREAMAEAHEKISKFGRPERIFLSLGGANTDEVRNAIEERWAGLPIRVEREASGDAILEAAKYMSSSAVVMCGTGSVAVGDVKGERKYCGGWGPIYGDGGSGGGIGSDALRIFLRSVDTHLDIGEIATLFSDLTAGLDIGNFSDRMELKRRALDMSRRELAALAPKIYALAEGGDKTALMLYENAAREIAELAFGVSENSRDFCVLLCGGFFKNKPLLIDACTRYYSTMSTATLKYDPDFSPAVAAKIAVLRDGGVKITDEIFKKVLKN